MRTRDSWHARGFRTLNPLGRLQSPLKADDPGHIAQVLARPTTRAVVSIDMPSGKSYAPDPVNFFYTSRAIQSPTTGMSIPYETPVFVDWTHTDRIADIGIELQDDSIEARFVRDGGTYFIDIPTDIAVAALGLSYVLRGEHHATWMHDALEDEFNEARANKRRELERRMRDMGHSPIAEWWNERGVSEESYRMRLLDWELERGRARRWSHFRHAEVAAESSSEDFAANVTESPHADYEQPPVVPVRSELAYRVAKLLGTEERIRDDS